MGTLGKTSTEGLRQRIISLTARSKMTRRLDVKRLMMLAYFLLISLFCIFSLVDLSEFVGGVEYELFLEVQQQQHLRLLQIEDSVAQIIKHEEESDNSNFTSTNSTSVIVDSYQTPITKGGEDSDPVSRAR